MRTSLRALKIRAASVAAVGLLTLTPTAVFATEASAAVGSICLTALPSQARDTIRLIDAGGPFPYRQDGSVFQNREGILPSQSLGYYHEYTVKTPNVSTRGARRIVTGTVHHEDYYTPDHYASFRKVNFGC